MKVLLVIYNKGEFIMGNNNFDFDVLWVFNKKDARILYKCINMLVKNNGRRMVACDTVVGYTLLSLLQKHTGLSKDNAVCFYIDALCVNIGYSEYTDSFVLSVYEDEDYAARCRASA